MSRRQLFGSFLAGLMLVLATVALQAADAPPKQSVRLVLKLLADKDREFRAAGLDQVRNAARGEAFTQLFAAQLTKLDADGQVALLDALADRGDIAARSAVLDLLASSHDTNVRAAAISALGRLGGSEDLSLFIQSLSSGSSAERGTAQESLIQIRGATINQALAADLESASPGVKAALIDILATRRAGDECPAFVKATVDEDSGVRRAAMSALGQLGRPEQIARMLPGVLKAQKGSERDEAEKNIALICSRIENEDERGAALIDALNTVDEAQRDQLLSLLGRVGRKKLLDFVAGIATGKDAARRQLGIDALSKWPDASVADTLFEIVNQSTDPAQRDQAFRSYVKVSATRDGRSDKERLNRLKEGVKAAKTPEEIALVLNRVRTAYDIDALRFVAPYVDQPQYAQIACETIVEIAHHREVRDPNKAEVNKMLDKVIAVSKDPVVVERANRYKRGETWDRRSIRPRG
jgi:HEAT repeat protein